MAVKYACHLPPASQREDGEIQLGICQRLLQPPPKCPSHVFHINQLVLRQAGPGTLDLKRCDSDGGPLCRHKGKSLCFHQCYFVLLEDTSMPEILCACEGVGRRCPRGARRQKRAGQVRGFSADPAVSPAYICAAPSARGDTSAAPHDR